MKKQFKEISIYQMVKKSYAPSSIITKAGYDMKKVENFCFESASFVFVLKDKKTCIEICFAPEMINKWEEKEHPLFGKSAAKKRENRLHDLMTACRERFSDEEMLEMFNDLTEKEYVEFKSEEDIVFDLAMKGYCIFKPESTRQSDQLKEYAETNIFPYYNEQQAAILF